jgi:hypothetical protein
MNQNRLLQSRRVTQVPCIKPRHRLMGRADRRYFWLALVSGDPHVLTFGGLVLHRRGYSRIAKLRAQPHRGAHALHDVAGGGAGLARAVGQDVVDVTGLGHDFGAALAHGREMFPERGKKLLL